MTVNQRKLGGVAKKIAIPLMVGLSALAFSAAPALAAEGLGVTATFGTAGSENGEFAGPAGVAVNQSNGDVYVVDKGNNRVEQFSSTGTFAHQFNGTEIDGSPAGAGKEAPAKFSEPRDVAVDNSCFYHSLSGGACTSAYPSNGDVYVSDLGHGVIDKFSATGEYLSQLGPLPSAVFGVALDSAGNVWVYEENANVSEYSDTGTLVVQFNIGRGTSPSLAVDSADNVYLPFGGDQLGKYNASGEQQAASETEAISPISGLAVDLATNDLYVGLGTVLAQYGPFGEPFSEPIHRSGRDLAAGAGIAVNSTSHAVYLADSTGNDVAIFGPGPTPEKPETDPVSAVKHSTATLNGVLGGGESNYHFAYNTNGTCEGAGTTPVVAAVGSENVTAAVTGLSPNTEYTYCLVAENTFGPTDGPPVTFTTGSTTAVFSPTITTESVANVTPFDATFEAKILSENQATTWHFEYATAATGQTLEGTIASVGAGTMPGNLEEQTAGPVDIGGALTPNKTYYYRVVASNATGTEDGKVQQFTTEALKAPSIEAEKVTALSPTHVQLNALINPNFQTTSWQFKLGTNTSYALGVVPATAGVLTPPSLTSSVGQEVKVGTAGIALAPNTEYHYEVVASNATGSTEGFLAQGDKTFLTLPEPPTVRTEGASAVTASSASITGSVNPGSTGVNSATSYYFQYGTSTAYGTQLPVSPQSAGEGTSSVVEHAQLLGLEPGRTYHYRIVASNDDANSEGGAPQTVYGEDATFSTTPPPGLVVETGGVSAVTQTTASVSATIDDQGVQTAYELDLGADTSYGAKIFGNAGTGVSPETVTVALRELTPATTYHYRFLLTSPSGTVYGADRTFTTPGFPAGLPAAPVTEVLIPVPAIALPGEAPVLPAAKSKPKPTKCRKGFVKKHNKCVKKPKAKKADRRGER